MLLKLFANILFAILDEIWVFVLKNKPILALFMPKIS